MKALKTCAVATASSLILLGCSLQPEQPSSAQPAEDRTLEPLVIKASPPSKPFTAETLYALLVAEFAGSRERYDIALSNYMQQAHATRDPGVAARATHIAHFLNVHPATLSAAELWVELEPDNNEARFILSTELARANRLLEAFEQSTVLKQRGSTAIFQTIAAQASQGSDTEREKLLQGFREQLKKYPKDEQLLIGLGLLLQQQGKLDDAMSQARKALAADPDSVPAAVLEARLLHQTGHTQEAITKLGKRVAQHPENTSLRLQYARLLASIDLEKSYQQFKVLAQQNPQDADLVFTMALISNEVGKSDEAAEAFERLADGSPHSASAHFYLGQIAEQKGDLDEALEHYLAVTEGPDFSGALLQSSNILIRQGHLQEAHQHLEEARQRFPEEAPELYLIEAQALVDNDHLSKAVQVLTQGLQEFPDNHRLLYTRALTNEQRDKLVQTETDLRQILKNDPENAKALNALGYTLTDRTDRHEEALSLITKALSLKPNDPAILDSLGWVHYRMGNLDEALLRLRQAMKALPDHEIAAHLGEVLWISGFKEEAQDIWRQGLELHPDSRIIHSTIERLKPAQP